jgi:hypothetical protein
MTLAHDDQIDPAAGQPPRSGRTRRTVAESRPVDQRAGRLPRRAAASTRSVGWDRPPLCGCSGDFPDQP